MIVALILAKGHSTRLRRKNIKQFCGKPLVAWALIQLKYSQVDLTIVSTDDYAIAEVCRQYGAEVYWREHPEESAKGVSGGVPTWYATKYMLEKYKNIEIVLHKFCTSPLLRPGDIDRCINLCRETESTVTLEAPRYETFLNEMIDKKTSKNVIGDKGFKYTEEIGGLAILPFKIIQKTQEDNKEPDLFNISSLLDGTEVDYSEAEPHCYIAAEHWQNTEIDYQDEFDLAEFYMKKYILKDGEDVYEKYWNERQRCQTK